MYSLLSTKIQDPRYCSFISFIFFIIVTLVILCEINFSLEPIHCEILTTKLRWRNIYLRNGYKIAAMSIWKYESHNSNYFVILFQFNHFKSDLTYPMRLKPLTSLNLPNTSISTPLKTRYLREKVTSQKMIKALAKSKWAFSKLGPASVRFG